MSEYTIKDWRCNVLQLDFWAVSGFDKGAIRDGEIVLYSHYHAQELVRVLDEQDAEKTALLATIARQQEELTIAADMLEEVKAKVERYKAAIEEARQVLSNQTHGGAQYQPDVLEADSILAHALPIESADS